MQPAAIYNLRTDRGHTFRRQWTWTSAGVPVDLTGYTARLGIRTSETDETTEVLAVGTNAPLPVCITLGGPAGTITVDIPPATMTLDAGRYFYTLSVATGSDSYALLKGVFVVAP